MNLTTDRNQDISIVRVNEARLMYPLLAEFAGAVTPLIGSGEQGAARPVDASPTSTARRSAA